jgi:hypothetical protein
MNLLNNWKIIHAKAPEDGRYVACIEGLVASSNPRFPAASRIRTSYVTCYEMHGSSMAVITARRSEYLLGTRDPGEFLNEDFLKTILPERTQPPVATPVFDAAQSQLLATPEPD